MVSAGCRLLNSSKIIDNNNSPKPQQKGYTQQQLCNRREEGRVIPEEVVPQHYSRQLAAQGGTVCSV